MPHRISSSGVELGNPAGVEPACDCQAVTSAQEDSETVMIPWEKARWWKLALHSESLWNDWVCLRVCLKCALRTLLARSVSLTQGRII